jgi:hypothetical protein
MLACFGYLLNRFKRSKTMTKKKALTDLSFVKKELAKLMSKTEDKHCYCEACKKYRNEDDGDDLCLNGRRVMTMVYLLDEMKEWASKIDEIKDWPDFVGARGWDEWLAGKKEDCKTCGQSK